MRVSYDIPFGHLTADPGSPYLADYFNMMIPFELDLGWRFGRHLRLDAYGQAGFGFLHGGCSSGLDCSGTQYVVGGEVQIHFPAGSLAYPVDLWVGAGGGWEFATAKVSSTSASVTESYNGPQFTVTLGCDFPLAGWVNFGPYLGFTTGFYTHRSVSVTGGSGGEDIRNVGAHLWWAIGIHGDFHL